MDLHDALDLWRVGEPRKLFCADAGLNNHSYLVDAPEGRYFLRRYRDGTDFSRIRHEHALLDELSRADLSFETPRPLETEAGKTLVVVSGANFALFSEIPGDHPVRGDAGQVEACGRALGELDALFSGIKAFERGSTRSEFGELDEISTLVPDPPELAERLRLYNEERKSLRALFERLTRNIPRIYARLPRQLVHSDLSYGNVLMVGGRVSGILDFEFAAPDLRVLDFTFGLALLCLSEREFEARWPLVEAFSRGYGEQTKLTREEVEALPELLLLREVASLIYRTAFESEENLAARARSALQFEDWLRSNDEEIIHRVGGATLRSGT